MPDTDHSRPAVTPLYAPLKAVVVPLEQVPDPVFAQQTMGPGMALEPLEAQLFSPCDGDIVHLARTQHALTLRTDRGCELLIHLGLDTVDLEGEGINVHVAPGDRVSQGDLLWDFDADLLACRALSLITPLVVTSSDQWRCEPGNAAPGSVIARGAPLMALVATSMVSSTVKEGGNNECRELVTLALAAGLHARPAARLRAIARRHDCTLLLEHDVQQADATSLTALMGLSLRQGDTLEIIACGNHAASALEEAVALLTTPEATELDPGHAALADDTSTVVPSGDDTTCHGLTASPGLAVGPLVRLARARIEISPDREESAEDAKRALTAAIGTLDDTLISDIERARTEGRSAEADILEAHQAWLDDPALREESLAHIQSGRSAAFAWREVLEGRISELRRSESRLLAARADDLRDLQERLIALLAPEAAVAAGQIEMTPGAIVVSDEITPSQFLALDRAAPAGLCLAGGGTTSHVALLARARGLPCLAAMGPQVLEVVARHAGESVILDAQKAVLVFQPTLDELEKAREQIEQDRARARAERQVAHEPARTLDAALIEVCANVTGHEEARVAHEAGADGIGLMRSEFLFMAQSRAPDEQAQRDIYQQALDGMGAHPVIIRTLDIGADKQLDYLSLPPVPNPALGTRGIRLMTRHQPLLDVQLRALLSVRPLDRLGIMLPMVTEAAELVAVRERLEVLAQEMNLEGRPALGAMIEVPAAALCADQLAQVADFLSIGTNDLTQYTLAMDREDPDLAGRADVLHPAVLRLIDMTVKGAAMHRCPVGVCGAAAGDPQAWAALVALGVDELSVEPARVAAVKAGIRRLDRAALSRALRDWLDEPLDSITLRQRLEQWLGEHVLTSTTTDAGASRDAI
ncbi:Phosphocarrier protein HPr /phosphoenolpyruvate--protein phosphotransferase /PTS system IIA component, Glc family [Kushneria avicenniae]|uniref:phosphoenolpyruvate--protein phosphotransferase n=1 Tax=Kushneria avicenniae TaxID=402385 RepID=A0A1I1GFD8_9GAMM|nr:phosphoenolpyruvate--protein phosphotransferase [Kushneria avicenniae]SFC10281.1 Phosphocarrier protein HPr /phosphoenolpyruvate--protein phosphotransferase /PTS system IIA component, Glc family [Kushneria avicenniae]